MNDYELVRGRLVHTDRLMVLAGANHISGGH
jgi:hypothetical protein